jgi:hypothetical protein
MRFLKIEISHSGGIETALFSINQEGPVEMAPVFATILKRYQKPEILDETVVHKIRTIVIDPEARSINEKFLDWDETKDHVGKLNQLLYAEIGNGCQLIEAGKYFSNNDLLYVDEEGLFNTANYSFSLIGTSRLVGKGIVIGGTDSGKPSDCKISLEKIIKQTVWYSYEETLRYKSRFG